MRCLMLAAAMFAAASLANAALLKDVPVTLRQPDGTLVQCFATGDEYQNFLHDQEGYVAVQNPKTKSWVYAQEIDGRIRPTEYLIGHGRPDLPGLSKGKALLPPGSPTRFYDSKSARPANASGNPRLANSNPPTNSSAVFMAAPNKGTLNNITIFVRFADDPEFTHPLSDYSSLFNASGDGVVSLYSYFKEASYNQLSVSTSFYPTAGAKTASYVDNHPRGFYQVYDAGANPLGYRNAEDYVAREHALLDRAVAAVGDQVPSSINVDINGDGFIDNVCLIIRGNPDGWSSLLWPHQSVDSGSTAAIHGSRVGAYNIQIESLLLPDFVGVLCHEFFHSLGAPDLYRYSQEGSQDRVGDWFSSVGPWDLMADTPKVPQHMSAYLKYRYGGWLPSPALISQNGTYSLHSLTSSTNNAYWIPSPYSQTEWFLLEYRKKVGAFEQSLPGEGLLVYRINTAQDGLGDAFGPPDEVYIYRPGGTPFADGSLESAFFSSSAGRTGISDSSEPPAFLSDGSSGGLVVSDVGLPADQISFHVTLPSAGPVVPTPSKPAGPILGDSNTPYHFTTTGTVDSRGGALQYRFYWDDGGFSDWSSNPSADYSFFGSKTYNVRAQARSAASPASYSPWSNPLLVSINFATPSPFQLKQRVPPPTDSRMMIYSMVTGDIDGDGSPEVIVMYCYLPDNNPSNRFQDLVVYGWQDGQLQKKWNRYGSSLTYPEGWWLSVGDVDGDGRVEVLKNSEMIKFSAGKYSSTPLNFMPLAVGDANNDGILEAVSFDGTLYQYQSGRWVSIGQLDVPANISKVAIGDTDGDGFNEVVVTGGNGWNTGSVTIYRYTSGGKFSVLWQKSQWMNHFTDCKIADWDSDGKNEIILANDDSSSVRILKFANSTYSEVWSHIFGGYTGMGWVPALALGRVNPASTGSDLVIGLGGHCAQPKEGSGVYMENVGMLLHDADTSMGVGSLLVIDSGHNGLQDIVAGSTDGLIYVISVSPNAPPRPTLIPPSGTASFSTRGSSGQVVSGYVEVTVNDGSAPYGTAVFSYTQEGVVVSEVGVPVSPPTQAARFFVDTRTHVSAGSVNGTIDVLTGFAAVNPNRAMARLTLKLRDSTAALLAEGNIQLAPGEHVAKFLDQLLPDLVLPAGFIDNGLGSLEVTSDQPVSVLALRLTTNQHGRLLLTSTPVADLAKPIPAGQVSFPQIADGGGYQTTLIFMNTSNSTETGMLRFYGNNGSSLPFRLMGVGTIDAAFPYSVPAGGFLRLVSDGSASTANVGWAQLVPDSGKTSPVSAAILSLTQNGVLVTESGIPASGGTTHARIYVDKSGGHDTGLAVSNPGGTGLQITASAYQSDGSTPAGTGTNTLDLAPMGHDARFVGQLIAGLPDGFTGMLDLSSSSPFTALTLRSLTNGRGDFLLTTLPVVDVNQPPPTPLIFPQIANGGGYQTQIILMGASGATSTVTLSYLGNDGAPILVGR
ncbi:MAG: M6 family metalloprotease domain-containing protein [Acidobacteriia bacterium]|nr:M6 family metalloprotease domain-containing protein [Terriglobia bacterium]